MKTLTFSLLCSLLLCCNAQLLAQNTNQATQQIANGKRRLIILFHDIKGITADNLNLYLQTIDESVTNAGHYQANFTL